MNLKLYGEAIWAKQNPADAKKQSSVRRNVVFEDVKSIRFRTVDYGNCRTNLLYIFRIDPDESLACAENTGFFILKAIPKNRLLTY